MAFQPKSPTEQVRTMSEYEQYNNAHAVASDLYDDVPLIQQLAKISMDEQSVRAWFASQDAETAAVILTDLYKEYVKEPSKSVIVGETMPVKEVATVFEDLGIGIAESFELDAEAVLGYIDNTCDELLGSTLQLKREVKSRRPTPEEISEWCKPMKDGGLVLKELRQRAIDYGLELSDKPTREEIRDAWVVVNWEDQEDLGGYLVQNYYKKWISEERERNSSLPIQDYDAFESFMEGREIKARTKVEAGLIYLLCTRFEGFYDDLYEPSTLTQLKSKILNELEENVQVVERNEEREIPTIEQVKEWGRLPKNGGMPLKEFQAKISEYGLQLRAKAPRKEIKEALIDMIEKIENGVFEIPEY